MTYLERVQKEHGVIPNIELSDCPNDYGLKNSEACPFYGGWTTCKECWGRELEGADRIGAEE